jgi:hypothetical protein
LGSKYSWISQNAAKSGGPCFEVLEVLEVLEVFQKSSYKHALSRIFVLQLFTKGLNYEKLGLFVI